MSVFRVGQKVAAIDDLDCGISKGQVFTISEIAYGTFEVFDGVKQVIILRFVEKAPRRSMYGFDGRYFRPLVTHKTDISVFKAMLNTTPEKVCDPC